MRYYDSTYHVYDKTWVCVMIKACCLDKGIAIKKMKMMTQNEL